ncbi:50S ribosomal protein L21 [Candidatus Gottesmanbacteria bacterium RIFCSPLOWO2_01_FULL_39_12b]|uniref:Large ribosomal subunit protein bL21 n=1 Tax=Candidatus Gottesmanbacteria bacterium RIFCSPLOWO2_01_FULL_39_12b TaxID=1798388 RepID=A0A1F6AQ07_9BACT|nr:MAG: 50S ribosomal protein L21 [Candidatus Gottesmanbacteria bacterium RIFCSPLOWO2_01_FULL_39_12b]
MKYAIIQSGGKQYKVLEGQELLIDHLGVKEGSLIEFNEVLLMREDDKIDIGEPYVKTGKVVGKIMGEEKGTKLKVSKFKAKVRYRKTIGFRSLNTRVEIEKIIKGDGENIKPKVKTDKKRSKK